MTDCQEWTGTFSGNGYGQITVEGKRFSAHRHTWQSAHGPIPEGMVIMHLCDNKRCVALGHLKLGTQRENMADAWGKGLVPKPPITVEGTHCAKGHPYDGRRDGRGWQICTPCERERKREWMRNKRAMARNMTS